MEENTSPVEQVGSIDILVILLAKEMERALLLDTTCDQQRTELDKLGAELIDARRTIDDQADEISNLTSAKFDALERVANLLEERKSLKGQIYLKSEEDYASAPLNTVIDQLGADPGEFSFPPILTRVAEGWQYSGSLAFNSSSQLAGQRRRVRAWGVE